MPDKSWMLYLLELFVSSAANHHTPIELNLICQFNDQDNFWAIFAEVNRYKFTKVVPIVGHSYLREIILHRYNNSIEYRVTDLDDDNDNNNATEHFTFQLDMAKSTSKSFQGSNQFTGIEWWNKAGNSPFPIRYEIEFSNLRYAQEAAEEEDSDGKNIERVTFRPYDALVPNRDGNAKEYPVSFGCADIKDNGCILYTVTAGSCKTGLAFLPVR